MTPAAYIDRHASRLAQRLRKLVALPTVNPPGEHYDAITRLLTNELSAIGLKARRYPIPAALLRRTLPRALWAFPRYNVLGRLRSPGATKTIHFNAHYDVVPVSGAWRHGSSFSGAISRGWIYGRGTADMKGSHAALLLALESLQATGTRPRLNVEVSFTADEETDSTLGAGWLVRHAPIAPDYAIVMEGGEEDRVCCGHNGTLWLEVAVHGRAAHGSRPDLGVNALEKMSALVLELQEYARRLAKRTFKAPDGTVMHPTLNLGGVFGPGPGGKINTVPAFASFSIDRRVLPRENHAAAERELRAELAASAGRLPGCRITVTKISENFSCYSEPAHTFFCAMAASVARVRRTPAVFAVSTGFNDMHFFSHHRRIPTLGYGPGGRNEHAVDERASLHELRRCAKIYADLLTSFSG